VKLSITAKIPPAHYIFGPDYSTFCSTGLAISIIYFLFVELKTE